MQLTEAEKEKLKRGSSRPTSKIGYEKLDVDGVIMIPSDDLSQEEKASIRSRISHHSKRSGQKLISRHAEKDGVYYMVIMRIK